MSQCLSVAFFLERAIRGDRRITCRFVVSIPPTPVLSRQGRGRGCSSASPKLPTAGPAEPHGEGPPLLARGRYGRAARPTPDFPPDRLESPLPKLPAWPKVPFQNALGVRWEWASMAAHSRLTPLFRQAYPVRLIPVDENPVSVVPSCRTGWLGSNEVSPSPLSFRGLAALDPGHPNLPRPNLGTTEFPVTFR